MHKGVIILVKAEDREDAQSKVEEFLQPYGDGDVWDWYAVGGRWNGTLAPIDKLKKFQKKCNKILVKENGFLSQSEVDNKQELLQQAWEKCGLKGQNSYCNHYNLPDDGSIYDIIPLEDCLPIVKEWCEDLNVVKQEAWEQMIKAKQEAEEGKYDMSGYYAGIYKNYQYENFCFESNVYDISTGSSEKLPENTKGYWAVMVDMHN